MEHLSDASLRRQFDTNVLGVVRMVRHVAPAMRERRSGTIINISSVAGLIAVPFTAAYSASKHAVEALSEALWFELRPFDVRVVLIEPGGFQTNFGDNVIVEPSWDEHSPYRAVADRFSRALEGFRAGPPQIPRKSPISSWRPRRRRIPSCAISPATTRACSGRSISRWNSRPSFR